MADVRPARPTACGAEEKPSFNIDCCRQEAASGVPSSLSMGVEQRALCSSTWIFNFPFFCVCVVLTLCNTASLTTF